MLRLEMIAASPTYVLFRGYSSSQPGKDDTDSAKDRWENDNEDSMLE
jgi:hypothetical protein